MIDYIINKEAHDWPLLLDNWGWCLPDNFGVLLVNTFGDIILETENGGIHLLDINGGGLSHIADSRESLMEKLAITENTASWFYLPLVDALRAQGLILKDGECYAFRKPPALGGDYHPDNVRIARLADNLAFTGDFAEQLQGVGDGAEVALKVRGEDFLGCEKPDCCSKGPNPTPGSCKTP